MGGTEQRMNREEPNLKALIAFEKTAASGNLT